MNLRKEQKQKTRRKIIDAGKKLFSENGFLNTNTLEIAKLAGIAHGTLFLHFPTKENLILEILDELLLEISNKLHDSLSSKSKMDDLLNNYLDMVSKEEKFFSNLAKETAFYPAQLKRQIIFREAGIRKYFFEKIEEGIASGTYKKLNIAEALNFLFGTVNYFLVNDKIFSSDESVIKIKKNHVINTFLTFIKRSDYDRNT